MFSKTDPGNHDYTGNSNSGQMLMEIEAISNALYLRKPRRRALLLPADKQHQSATKTRFYETKAKTNPEFLGEDVPHKEGKISSVWNWKKPLKSLAHIGHRKFTCLFNLHVHSIDGLPPHFNYASLRVNWKRKDDISQTRASTVFNGVSEFNETLILKCSVYGGRSGPNHLAKYEPELFMIYVSVNGVPRLDIGKHWVDVTRLLPPTLEELEREKSLGRWTTSFKLSGKADGALLQVSFGFLMMKNGLIKLGHLEVPKLLNLMQNRPNTAQITSVFGTTTAEMAQPVDEKICQEILLNPRSELSESIDFLYQKLDDPKFESGKESKQDLYDRTEFTVVDCGVEIDNEKTRNFDEATADMVIDKKMEYYLTNDIYSKYVAEVGKDENSLLVTKSIIGWVDSPSKRMFSARREPSLVEVKLLEQDNLTDMGASHRESITLQGSSSLDDVNEAVISDFLGRLGLECGSSMDAGCHPESPRELLLRQFEEETLASCNSLFYCDAPEERPNHGSCDFPASSCDKYNGSFDFVPSIRVREEHKSASQLRNRRKAQVLENLETEALMQKWGIKEKDFQYSPRNCPAGFGSPIELSVEDPWKSPPLGEGCGSLVQLKGGGFLRSMNPALFKDSRNEGRLIIQLSHLVVLPAEMGSHFMEILQCFTSMGADKLYMQINKLMPLEDLYEKTIPQIEGSSSVGYKRKSLLQDNEIRVDYTSPKDLVHLAMDKIEVLSLEGLKIQSDMSNEEAPSRISLFSDRKSSVVRAENSVVGEFQRSSSDVEGLMDLSLPFEEWLKLDAGIIGNNNDNHDSIIKILAAHHAKSIDMGKIFTRVVKMGKASSAAAGLMGNSLTLALMLQLKDPLRNSEPVGRPMVCLIQVERVDKLEDKELVYVKERPYEFDKGEGSYRYTITDIHLLGVNSEPGRDHAWGTTAQHMSGTRWLLASGKGRTFRHPHPYSKAGSGARSSSTATKMKQEDVLWSLSSHVNGKTSIWEELKFCDSHIRNPDLIFQNETTEKKS